MALFSVSDWREVEPVAYTACMRKLMFLLAALSCSPLTPHSQSAGPAGWNDPFPPHKIMDNFYYVGTKELASFLVATPQGLILMNSDYEACSLNGRFLQSLDNYPGIVDDFRATYKKARTLAVELWV